MKYFSCMKHPKDFFLQADILLMYWVVGMPSRNLYVVLLFIAYTSWKKCYTKIRKNVKEVLSVQYTDSPHLTMVIGTGNSIFRQCGCKV